jgi:cysteine-rich repeat protein
MAVLLARSAPALAAPGGTCADAISVDTLPFMASATTCAAGNDFTNDIGGTAVCSDLPKSYGGEDVFYKVVLGPGNKVAFDLTMPGGATGDLALFLVRQPSCADPPACAANSVDLIGAGLGPERIKLQSYPAGTYYLIVDSALPAGNPGQCGAYDLAITGHLSEFCGNGIVETGEVCDDGNNVDSDCCSADCQTQKAAGTICHDVAGPCDVLEVCDGSGHCPTDKFKASTEVCRHATTICDEDDFCSGSGPSCPADRVAAFGKTCRRGVGRCDREEICDGISKDCPPDKLLPTGAICASGSVCAAPARCAGTADCPPPMPINCNDNNDCTRDSCDPVSSCVHVPICMDAGTDAAADARPDVAPDLTPDLAADMSTRADAPLPQQDAPLSDAPSPRREDAPPSDDVPRTILPDAALDTAVPARDVEAESLVTGPLGGPDDAATGPIDAGAGPDGLSNPRPDATWAGDSLADLGSSTDRRTSVAGDGCSCRLNSSSSRGESILWAAPILVLVFRIARRRRRHV